MNLDKDLTDMYILGIKQVESGFYNSATATISLIRETGVTFPKYELIANSYINHLIGALRRNNSPISSELLGLEQKINQKQRDEVKDGW